MKPNPISWILALLVALSLTTACGAKSTDDPNNGGRTHWLKACDVDAECGTYQCIAKICTIACSTDRDCEGHGAPASCTDEVCAPVESPARADRDASTGNQDASCEHDDVVYAHGDDVPLDDCNHCSCNSGEILCTEMICPEPTPEGDEALCLNTGGFWGVSCGHFICGEPSPLECLTQGCNCGSERNFTENGCVVDPACGFPQELTEGCGGWESLECAENTSEALEVVVEIDGALDDVLDVPVETHCSLDVFFRWSACVPIGPSLWAKSSEGQAALDLQFSHSQNQLLLTFGEYVDSSGVRWTLSALPDATYTPAEASSGVVDVQYGYLGQDTQGREARIDVHAVACAGYYPCLL